MIKKLIAAVAVLSFGVVAQAALVDQFTGATWKVYPTTDVQAVIDGAAAGDIIEFAAGDYQSGSTETTLAVGVTTRSRLVVNKKLYLKGAGRERTIIHGADATSPDGDGLGADAVRGILLTADAAGSLIEGLKVVDGRTVSYDKNEAAEEEEGAAIFEKVGGSTTNRLKMAGQNLASRGGGILYAGEDKTAPIYLVDCWLSKCRTGYAGGAIYGWAVLIRTRVDRSYALATFGGSITRVVGGFSCVFTSNGKKFNDLFDSVHGSALVPGVLESEFVNCTMCSNLGSGMPLGETPTTKEDLVTVVKHFKFRNCIFYTHGNTWRYVRAQVDCENCCQDKYGSLKRVEVNILDENGKPIPRADDPSQYYQTNTVGNVGTDRYPRLDEDKEGTSFADSPVKAGLMPAIPYGRYQFLSGLGDWRLRTGSILIDRGRQKWIDEDAAAFVPTEYLTKDYNGADRVQGDAPDQGACEGGFDDEGTIYTIIDAERTQSTEYLYVNDCYVDTSSFATRVTGLPGATIDVEIDTAADIWGYEFAAVRVNEQTGRNTLLRIYPDYRGKTVRFRVGKASARATETLTFRKAQKVVWVSPDGNDNNAGTEAAPYKTLQRGVDQAGSYGLVLAKEGTYDEGGLASAATTDADWPQSTGTRVEIAKAVRLVGVDGPQKTIIMGAEGTSGFINRGCGEGAYRCVSVTAGVYCQVQGFTLTGGHTDSDPIGKSYAYQVKNDKKQWKSGDADSAYNWAGGGICASGYNNGHMSVTVRDCIISNNVAYRGAAVCNAILQRCEITGNRTVDPSLETNCVTQTRNSKDETPKSWGPGKATLIRYAIDFSTAVNCYIHDNDDCRNGAVGNLSYSALIENCLFHETNQVPIGVSSTVYNNIFYGCKTTMAYSGKGNVVWPASASWTSASQRTVDPVMSPAVDGGYRIWAGSPVVNEGYETTSTYADAFYCKGLRGGWPIYENGRTAAGPYQDFEPFVYSVSVENAKGEGDKKGLTVVGAGESVTFTAAEPQRHLLYYRLNGVELPATDNQLTYTFPTTGSALMPAEFTAVYSTNWYANANAADDSGTGWTPETPKKTLNAALAYAIAGDVVHAAEGVYKDNAKVHDVCVCSSAGTAHRLPAVAIVPKGVTLVADGEQAKTVIEGKWGTGPDVQSMTFGDDAVRGLVMYENAKLKGFTVYNCGTMRGTHGDGTAVVGEDDHGACVLGKPSVICEDCFFTNCVGVQMGLYKVSAAIRCKFIRIGASSCYAVSYGGSFYNCLVDWCFDSPINNADVVKNCTIGPNNAYNFDYAVGGGRPNTPLSMAPGGVLENTIMIQPKGKDPAALTFTNAKNCIFHSDYESIYTLVNCENVTFKSLAELKFDSDCRPSYGSVAIDAGDNDSLEEGLGAGTDLSGRPRIANGTVDIGCYEAQHLYVDATKTDDSGDGFTKGTAKKTLKGVMEIANAGDCVHAAPGVYNKGSMKHAEKCGWVAGSDDVITLTRCVIPEGVALVSDEGAENTVIEGYKEPGSPGYPWYNTYNCGFGPNAMRGVAMNPNSYLKGFTITNCSMNVYSGSPVSDNTDGAGILCKDNTALIEDCFITRCAAQNGSCAYRGTYRRCKMTFGVAVSNGGAFYGGNYYNCLFDACADKIGYLAMALENCTIGPNNMYFGGTSGTRSPFIISLAGSGYMRNTLVMSAVDAKNTNTYARADNCVFAYLNDPGQVKITNGSNNQFVPYASLKAQFDDISKLFTPKTGACTIDAGVNTNIEEADVNGNQRIYNGTVDIGCYEYDWRPEYADHLKKDKVEVIEASPNVVLADNTLTLNPDAALTLKTTAASTTDYTVGFTVSDGTLAIDDTNYTASGSHTLTKPVADTTVTFSYSGEGSATLLPFLGGYEAMIGEMSYEAFGDAYAVAEASDAIKLLVDVTWAPVYGTDDFKTVAINKNGFNLSIASASVNAFNEKGYQCKFDDTTLKVGLPFGGLGTANDPYTIADAETIRLLANGVNASSYGVGGSEYFKQTADIDLNNVPFAGIGSSVNFSGHYDGFGKTVRNLVFTNATYRGFFAQTKNATVKDLTIELGVGDTLKDKEGNVIGSSAFSLSGYDYANPTEFGGAAMGGKVESTSFTGCTTKGAIACTHNAGGFVVRPLAGSTFTDCTNLVNVVGTYTKVGGFAVIVQNEGVRFTRCVNKGNVSTYGNRMLTNNDKTVGCDGVGGVLAYTSAALTMDSCVNEGTITYTATEVVNPSPDETAHVGIVCVGSFAGLLKESVTFAGANTVNNTNMLAVGCCLATPSPATSFLATVDDNGIATFPATIALGGSYKVMAYGVDTCNLQFTKNDVPRENPIKPISFDRSLYAGFVPTVTPAVGVKVTGPAIDGDVLTYTVRRRMGTLMILQ